MILKHNKEKVNQLHMDTGSSYTIIETDDESEMLVKENIDKKR